MTRSIRNVAAISSIMVVAVCAALVFVWGPRADGELRSSTYMPAPPKVEVGDALGDDARVRWNASAALVALRPAGLLDDLRRQLFTPNTFERRCRAASAIAKIGESAFPLLIEAVSSEDLEVRDCALEAIPEVRPRRSSHARSLAGAIARANSDMGELSVAALAAYEQLGAEAVLENRAFMRVAPQVAELVCQRVGARAANAISKQIETTIDRDELLPLLRILAALGKEGSTAVPSVLALARTNGTLSAQIVQCIGAISSKSSAAHRYLSDLLVDDSAGAELVMRAMLATRMPVDCNVVRHLTVLAESGGTECALAYQLLGRADEAATPAALVACSRGVQAAGRDGVAAAIALGCLSPGSDVATARIARELSEGGGLRQQFLARLLESEAPRLGAAAAIAAWRVFVKSGSGLVSGRLQGWLATSPHQIFQLLLESLRAGEAREQLAALRVLESSSCRIDPRIQRAVLPLLESGREGASSEVTRLGLLVLGKSAGIEEDVLVSLVRSLARTEDPERRLWALRALLRANASAPQVLNAVRRELSAPASRLRTLDICIEFAEKLAPLQAELGGLATDASRMIRYKSLLVLSRQEQVSRSVAEAALDVVENDWGVVRTVAISVLGIVSGDWPPGMARLRQISHHFDWRLRAIALFRLAQRNGIAPARMADLSAETPEAMEQILISAMSLRLPGTQRSQLNELAQAFSDSPDVTVRNLANEFLGR